MHGNVVILHRRPGMTQMASRRVANEIGLAETFRSLLDEQERFCDQLEAIADALPAGVCHMTCARLARTATSLVRAAHHFEESRIFPLLSARPDIDDKLVQSLGRLEWEHIEDEGYADEIAEALTGLSGKPRPDKADSLGYMLRGFFESMRRHIAFEREYLLPIVQRAEREANHA